MNRFAIAFAAGLLSLTSAGSAHAQHYGHSYGNQGAYGPFYSGGSRNGNQSFGHNGYGNSGSFGVYGRSHVDYTPAHFDQSRRGSNFVPGHYDLHSNGNRYQMFPGGGISPYGHRRD